MSTKLVARSGHDGDDFSFFLLHGVVVVVSHWNRLIEAILLSTDDIPFSQIYKKIFTLNYLKSQNYPRSGAVVFLLFFRGTWE